MSPAFGIIDFRLTDLELSPYLKCYLFKATTVMGLAKAHPPTFVLFWQYHGEE